MTSFRWIMDPLYGHFELDSMAHELLGLPIVQRLRYVSLSNVPSIQSPSLATASRYEHSIGVLYLASLAAHNLQLSKKSRLEFQLASILHDAAITPLGHLAEEAMQLSGLSFDHEKKLQEAFGGAELGGESFQAFRGQMTGITSLLDRHEWSDQQVSLSAVTKLREGEGPLGELLAGSVDIDNIDNVCRVAVHLGLDFDKHLPLNVIRHFSISGNRLRYSWRGLEELRQWLRLRFRVYSVLMTNPVDFISKAMLVKAVAVAVESGAIHEHDWKLTDPELFQRLAAVKESSDLLTRFELNHLYEMPYFSWITFDFGADRFFQPRFREQLAEDIAQGLGVSRDKLAIYAIKDKRHRSLKGLELFDESFTSVGYIGDHAGTNDLDVRSSSILFGVCVATKISNKHQVEVIRDIVSSIPGVVGQMRCDPIAHLRDATICEEPQKKLFGDDA